MSVGVGLGGGRPAAWDQVAEGQLEDSRQQEEPLPLQFLPLIREVTARFIKFEVKLLQTSRLLPSHCSALLLQVTGFYGKGGGLQYFDIQRENCAGPGIVLSESSFSKSWPAKENSCIILCPVEWVSHSCIVHCKKVCYWTIIQQCPEVCPDP